MKFENVRVFNFEGALRGMRNPKNSWDRSDSLFGLGNWDWATDDLNEIYYRWFDDDEEMDYAKEDHIWKNGVLYSDCDMIEWAFIGPKDMKLAQTLIKGGSEHRKFLRQIFVSVDITAPLYWWKEFDTYKVGTVANSTSTMHKITSKPITIDCFEIDDYQKTINTDDNISQTVEEDFIPFLEHLRIKYLETNDKRYWKELIRWLPESWLQTRTVTMNYENLLSMYHQRKSHKLTEWSKSYIDFIKSLPYASELIIFNEES